MRWAVVEDGVIDAWLAENDDEHVRTAVLGWLLDLVDGPGPTGAIPARRIPDLFYARVPDTDVIVGFLALPGLDPPVIAIRSIATLG